MNYTEYLTDISNIKSGDTVIHNDKLMTVCDSDIKRSELMGLSLFGDNYHCGNKKVIKVSVLNTCTN